MVNVVGMIPWWSVALVIGIAGAVVVQLVTKLHEKPKFHWV